MTLRRATYLICFASLAAAESASGQSITSITTSACSGDLRLSVMYCDQRATEGAVDAMLRSRADASTSYHTGYNESDTSAHVDARFDGTNRTFHASASASAYAPTQQIGTLFATPFAKFRINVHDSFRIRSKFNGDGTPLRVRFDTPTVEGHLSGDGRTFFAKLSFEYYINDRYHYTYLVSRNQSSKFDSLIDTGSFYGSFPAGTDVDLDIIVDGSAAADANNYVTGFGANAVHSASALDFGDTIRWGGIGAVTNAITGAPIDDWHLESSSGVRWDLASPVAAAVPEPAGYLLLSIGLGAMAACGRRRSQHQKSERLVASPSG